MLATSCTPAIRTFPPRTRCHRRGGRRGGAGSAVNPAHLFAGTSRDNVHDMMVNFRSENGKNRAMGERSGMAKLTEDAVRAIRADTRTGTVIAAEYGVNHTLIYAIKNRKIWRHVQ